MRPTLLVVAFVIVGAVAAGAGTVVAEGADAETAETNESFGASVSSFMQASAVETESEVDDGMFDAALDRTDDPEEQRAIVDERQQRLEERTERLEDARASIDADDTADATVRDRAIAVRIGVGAAALERSIDKTGHSAERIGADAERLDQLRENARNLNGSELSDLAAPPAMIGPANAANNAVSSINGDDSDVREEEQERNSSKESELRTEPTTPDATDERNETGSADDTTDAAED